MGIFFTSSHFVSQFPPNFLSKLPLECITSFRCITLEWHFWPGRRSKYNSTKTLILNYQSYHTNPPIKKNKQTRNCWWSKYIPLSDVLLWTPTHGHTSVSPTAKTFIHQLHVNTGYRLEDQTRIMTDSCHCLPPDRTWQKVNDPKVDYSGGLGEGKFGHEPRLKPYWTMMQLAHLKVAQSKLGALRSQVCLYWTIGTDSVCVCV